MCLTGFCLLIFGRFASTLYQAILIKLILLAPSEIAVYINNEEEDDHGIQLEDEDEYEDELDANTPEVVNDEDEEDREQSGMIFKEMTFFIY